MTDVPTWAPAASRRHVRELVRRLIYLDRRIAEAPPGSSSGPLHHIKHEASALRWTLDVLESLSTAAAADVHAATLSVLTRERGGVQASTVAARKENIIREARAWARELAALEAAIDRKDPSSERAEDVLEATEIRLAAAVAVLDGEPADYDGPADKPNGAWSGGFADNH